MKRKEILQYRVLALVTLLGILSMISAACSAEASANMSTNPTYTRSTTITTCINMDENPWDCSKSDVLLADVPFTVETMDRMQDKYTDSNGQITFDFPDVISWNLNWKQYAEKTGRCPERWIPTNADRTTLDLIFELCNSTDT